ncbi:MAG: MFS transporter [Actinobacteria bacterium]|nr:MAG: MFS transporter [Actinomycetota bacterium]
MRRLLVLVSVVVAVDTLFFTALTPLVPHFADKYELSKADAGVFISTYAAGTLLGAIPAGLATIRLGPKPTVLIGLALMTTASLGSLAGDIWALGLSRLFQGVGSSCSWAGGLAWVIASTPRERRGELLGTAMGAAVFGALLGPVLGALAGIVGIRAAFLGVTVAGVALAGWAAATPGVAPERQALRAGLLAMRERSLVVGLWLIVLPALLFGVLIVLVPLRLSQHGWGTIAIGALFLATTALEMVLNPLLGRLTDRRGRMRPVRAALLASILVSAALAWATEPGLIAPLVLASGIAYGAFYTPGLALVSHGAELAGVAQGLAFGLVNACWGIGALVGPAAGGALAGVAGDAVPYLVLAGVCVATYLATRARYAEPEPVGELP